MSRVETQRMCFARRAAGQRSAEVGALSKFGALLRLVDGISRRTASLNVIRPAA